jgi:hypothetical protein
VQLFIKFQVAFVPDQELVIVQGQAFVIVTEQLIDIQSLYVQQTKASFRKTYSILVPLFSHDEIPAHRPHPQP